MASIRFRILTEIARRLNLARPGTVPEFSLYSSKRANSQDHPTAAVYPGAEGIEPTTNRAGPLVSRQMAVIVEVRSAAENPFEEIDAALVWITSIMGGVRLSDSDGVLSQEVMEKQVQWRVASSDHGYVVAHLYLDVPYSTKVRDQELYS